MRDSLLGATKTTTELAIGKGTDNETARVANSAGQGPKKRAAEGSASRESVGGEYLVLRAEIDRLEAVAAGLLARCDSERPWQVDGYSSTTAWLTHRARMRRGRARRLVIEARALAEMPSTAGAFATGDLSVDQTAELIRARSAQPDEFPAYEHTLADSARDLDWVADLRTVCDYWQQAVAESPPVEAQSQRDARYLHVSPTFESMVKLDGLLDPDTGAELLEKLEAAVPPPDGHRTAGQRRADTLVDLVLGYSTAPTTTVLVHLDDTQQVPDFDFATTNRGRVLPQPSIDRLLCDSQIERIIHAADGRILDHGRTMRVISPALKRALIARDRHCRFPGCRRPPWWTEGHHIEHWSEGGRTSMDNLILLCRHHHRLIHEHGFTLEGPGHDPTFRTPDRTILEWHPPPPN